MSPRRPESPRVHIEAPFPELAALYSVGSSDTHEATPWLAHGHSGAEIHFLKKGVVWCWLGDDLVRVTAGHVLFTLPFERHGSRYGAIGPNRMYWTAFALAEGDEPWLGLTARESVDLVAALRALPRRTVAATPVFVAAFEQLLASAEQKEAARSVTRARSSLLALLLALIDEGQKVQQEHSLMVSRALELMGTHLEHPLSPVELCAKLGWGRSQLQEAFRVQMGMAPSEYYTSLRVLEACERLERTDASVTRIGGDLGFASTPYFSTAFKRVTGLSPQEFRRAVARYAASDEIPPPTPYG